MECYLSCISTHHSQLKAHWANADRRSAQKEGVQGTLRKPRVNLGGLICRIDRHGFVSAKLDTTMPAGMVASMDGILFAGRTAVHAASQDLSVVQPNVLTSPLFNALHTIRPSQRGYLIGSTGLDLILEVAPNGEVLWQWWAVDHGLNETPFGHTRTIERGQDHRDREYGTLMQTTHVNSAIELPDGAIIATLFHQGQVVQIDRARGCWQSLIDDLPNVHAARVVDDKHITVADTKRGRGLLLRIDGDRAQIADAVTVATDWLQDCIYLPTQGRWVLLDGRHSRMLLLDDDKRTAAPQVRQFDPEWRLYEILPIEESTSVA